MATLSGIITSTSLITANNTLTLANKTLTAPVINSPTGIVKGDVGLGNVDNTSDATKNAATATLTNKTLTSPVINTPTGIVKGDVGLGNVDNTSDATKNSATATLTNKTIDYANNTLTDVAGVTATQTLTNKTLTAPTIASANLVTALTLSGASGTSGQFLTSAGSGNPPTWTDVSPSITLTSSGTIANGSLAVLNSNGTVSQITSSYIATLAANGSFSFSSSSAFNAVCYDTKRNRYYVAYSTGGSINFMTGNASLSGFVGFGTPVQITTGGANVTHYGNSLLLSYDETADKVVLVWQSSAFVIKCLAGIPIDAGVGFPGSATDVLGSIVQLYSIAYDKPNKQHFVVYGAYSSYYLHVGYIDVTGSTPVSSSSALATLDNTTSNYDRASIALDTVNQRAVVTWKKDANYNVTVNTFGYRSWTKNADQPITSSTYPYVAYVSSNKYVFSYNNASNYPSFVIGTLAGNVMTYATPVVFLSSAQSYWSPIVVLNSDRFFTRISTKVFLPSISGTTITAGNSTAYETDTGLQAALAINRTFSQVITLHTDGTGKVWPLVTTNLTEQNFVGISRTAYSNNQSASIQTVGSNASANGLVINSGATTLEPGKKYYATTTGQIDLGISPAYVGLATSNTSILIKG